MKPIEYIGSQPRKSKPTHFFGGWVILLAAVGTAAFFGMRFSDVVLAKGNRVDDENREATISLLELEGSFPDRLAASALQRTKVQVTYDSSYHTLEYPNGDVPADKGRETDVIIRSFRGVGVDLQKEIHEDMKANYRLYPQIYGAAGPDHSIDHRRVPNLQRYFNRHGEELAKSREEVDYAFGDIVTWFLGTSQTHMGIVVPGPGNLSAEKWIVHNIGAGPVWEDALFKWQVIGHYRFDPDNVPTE